MGRTRQAIRELTPRQREVLALVAKGHTNAEIAEQLGITLAGAKWHVSELLTRLDVDSREELADFWAQETGLRGRLGRFAAALGGLVPVKAAAGVVGGLALLSGVGVAVLVARQNNAAAPAAPHGDITLLVTTRTMFNYDHRLADGLTALDKYDQADASTESYWQMRPSGQVLQIKNLTKNRDGQLTQEELMAGGGDTVYQPAVVHPGLGQTAASCSSAAFDQSTAKLATASTTALSTEGYKPSALDAKDRAMLLDTNGRALLTYSRIEPVSGMFVPNLRHVAVFDAKDGSLYGDIVWAVAADGSETLWEARLSAHPKVVKVDDSIFSMADATACQPNNGRGAAAASPPHS